MFKKPQIVSILFVFLIAGFVLITTNCDFDVGALMEKIEAESLWEDSGHADRTSEAFWHWDEDDPAEVSTRCAKCHSTSGFEDFLLDDSVDNAVPVGETVECEVCHTDPDNGTLRDHTDVTFPSGVTIDELGPEAICMECHQGRKHSGDVDDEITDAVVPDNDTPSSDMGFPNIHYAAAGASLYGTFVQGGYEYDGNDYDAKFGHVKGYTSCIACHDPHSLEVRIERCGTCHTGITDPKNIRYYGSFVDYDGDGDMTEGIYYEIPDFQDKLYEAIQEYARDIGFPIVYDSHSHPYWFYDTNDNGVPDGSEVSDTNEYESFTGRLLKACYNYQVSLKDHGAYAHGGKYLIQLLYDSLEDLNSVLTVPVDIDDFERDDEGHFDGSAGPWRFFDRYGEVWEDCAKCHSAEGLPYFLENDAHIAQEPSNGLLCTTCHTSPPTVRTVGAVTFPSGASKDMGDSSNICLNCHQGLGSMVEVDEELADSSPWRPPSIHYLPVGAILYGTEVQGGYEYLGKIYAGRNTFPSHNGRFDTCVECHMGTNTARETHEPSDHNVHKPNPEDCVFCHGYDVSQPNQGYDPSLFKFSGIRPGSIPDFDADGDTVESLKEEIQGLEIALVQQAGIVFGSTLVGHNGSFYIDFLPLGWDENDTRISSFSDARLFKAAYNFQMTYREPHAYIHNPFYIAQLFVDSIEDLGGNIAIYTWR